MTQKPPLNSNHGSFGLLITSHLKVLSTDRDAPMLVVNGFTYHNHMAGSVKVLWRCTIKGCKGTVSTYRDYELSMVAAERRDHFHLPDPLALERARFTKKLKDKWAEVEYFWRI